jgi:hypothetical protein
MTDQTAPVTPRTVLVEHLSKYPALESSMRLINKQLDAIEREAAGTEAHTHKVNAGCFPSCPAHYSRSASTQPSGPVGPPSIPDTGLTAERLAEAWDAHRSAEHGPMDYEGCFSGCSHTILARLTEADR